MNIRKFTPLLVLLFLCITSKSQESIFSGKTDRFTMREGLPHNTVISLCQDQTGFLWVGTINGLCRYNGINFSFIEVPLKMENHWSQVMEVIYKGINGTIWFGSRSGRIISYTSDSGHWRAHCKLSVPEDYVSCFYQENEKRLWLGTASGRVGVYNIQEGSLNWKAEVEDRVNHLFVDTLRRLWVSSSFGLTVLDTDCRELPKVRERFAEMNGRAIATVNDSGKFVFYGEDSCFVYAVHSGTITAYPVAFSEGLQKGVYNAGNSEYLWTNGKYLITFDEARQNFCRYSLAKDETIYAINTLLKDRSGLIWAATDIGLIKIDRKRYRFREYATQQSEDKLNNHYIRSLAVSGNEVWLGLKKGPVIKLHYDPEQRLFRKKEHYKLVNDFASILDHATINTILVTRAGDVWAGGVEGLFKLNKEKGIFENYMPHDLSRNALPTQEVWALEEDEKGRVWVASRTTGVWLIDARGKVEQVSLGEERALSVWKMYKDRQGRMWLGTSEDLFLVTEDREKQFRIRAFQEKRHDNIWDIKEDDFGNYYFASTDWGLKVYNKGTAKTTHYTRKEGLPSNSVCGVEIDKAGNAWLSTVNGLCRLEHSSGKVEGFTNEDGLISYDFNFKANAQNAQGELFYGAKSGLVLFDPEDFKEVTRVRANTVINSFQVNGSERGDGLKDLEEFSLRHDENNLSFTFSLLDFSRPAEHVYRYKLQPFDTEWKQTGARLPTAMYTNLPPASYTFKVNASADGVNWNNTPGVIHFSIVPAFWQQVWFIPALFLLLLGLLSFALYFRFMSRIKKARKKNEIEKKMASLELRALQAQMNPHFIFNAINSIQDFMLKGDLLAANDYLTRFARLMRFFLEASIKKKIRLSDEIAMLRLYVELEALRFDECFEYVLDCSGITDPHLIEIPSMLVQPHVENAIHHGLVTKEGEKKLWVYLVMEKERLTITIEDNGIGREKALQLRNTLNAVHQPRAMQLVEERLEVHNTFHAENIHMDIIDKRDEALKPLGTKVVLVLPL